jgi:hypothetical protein
MEEPETFNLKPAAFCICESRERSEKGENEQPKRVNCE